MHSMTMYIKKKQVREKRAGSNQANDAHGCVQPRFNDPTRQPKYGEDQRTKECKIITGQLLGYRTFTS